MRTKVSDYIIKMLIDLGIDNAFCVTGGPAAHIMDSLRDSSIKCIHNYHEQACALAADGYARIKKKPALVLLTNGPGSSNAITGVLSAFQDSIPMIVISGQVPRRQTLKNSGRQLRQFGVQEADILSIVKSITKYSVQIHDTNELDQHLRHAFKEATTGRQGPVWLDIPLDVQAEYLEVNNFQPLATPAAKNLRKVTDLSHFDEIRNALAKSKKPLIIAGAGVHLSNTEKQFRKLIEDLKIPVICSWSATDLFSYDDQLYVGNFGILGERAANLACQNADLLLILGCRLSIPSIGYATEIFSPNSFKIMVDIDENEMHKASLKIDLPIQSDLNDFFDAFISQFNKEHRKEYYSWHSLLQQWKTHYSTFNEDHAQKKATVNSYDFIKAISGLQDQHSVIVTDMGTSFTCTMQAFRNNGSNRLITGSACCPMGYGLPGAIGAYYAEPSNQIICIAGDGGMQMNIQELQTISHHKIPIKIFILNNNGYLAISLMQDNLFEGRYFGSTPSSGVSAPDFVKVAAAYGIPALRISDTDNLRERIKNEVLCLDGPILCEITMPATQLMIPRVQSKRDDSGKFISGSLADMFPYLAESEIDSINKSVSGI